MRITQNVLFGNLLKELNRNAVEMDKYQEQLSTGRRVNRPSDDSIAFTTSRIIEDTQRRYEQYQKNINNGLRQARTTQQSLDGMIDLLVEFKSTAISGANETLDADARDDLAQKVESLKENIMELANVDVDGLHLFAGTQSDTAPFTLDGAEPGGVKDTSNNTAISAKISDNSTVDTTISGDRLRSTSAGDLFVIMQDVADSLRANNPAQVNADLQKVDTTLNHVSSLATEIGSNINRMEYVYEQKEAGIIDQKGEISRLVDTNFSEAISNFRKFQTSYEAAMAVHSEISQTSLLDFLR